MCWRSHHRGGGRPLPGRGPRSTLMIVRDGGGSDYHSGPAGISECFTHRRASRSVFHSFSTPHGRHVSVGGMSSCFRTYPDQSTDLHLTLHARMVRVRPIERGAGGSPSCRVRLPPPGLCPVERLFHVCGVLNEWNRLPTTSQSIKSAGTAMGRSARESVFGAEHRSFDVRSVRCTLDRQGTQVVSAFVSDFLRRSRNWREWWIQIVPGV